MAYASDVDGKLFIDATNNIGAAATNAAAAVAQAAPNARYVRAFNTLGWENFANPTFDGVAADHFFSAPSADRDAIERLISDVGLRPAYLGPDKQDLVDSVLPLWLTLAQLRGQRHLAFRMHTSRRRQHGPGSRRRSCFPGGRSAAACTVPPAEAEGENSRLCPTRKSNSSGPSGLGTCCLANQYQPIEGQPRHPQ